jgi:hypothetical protein
MTQRVIDEMIRRQADYRVAQEEAEIRAELTERVRAALWDRYVQVGGDMGALAEAAVDALDQYVREGRPR